MGAVKGKPKERTHSVKADHVADRHAAFMREYKLNGGNATQAAISVGYAPVSAGVIGSRLVKRYSLLEAASEGEAAAFENARISTERVLDELRRLAFFDPRKLFDDKGNLKKISELDDDTAAALSSIDFEQITMGKGKDRASIGRTAKIRSHDKLGALDRFMRYHGLYERDNRQKESNLTIQVGLVTPPPRRAED